MYYVDHELVESEPSTLISSFEYSLSVILIDAYTRFGQNVWLFIVEIANILFIIIRAV